MQLRLVSLRKLGKKLAIPSSRLFGMCVCVYIYISIYLFRGYMRYSTPIMDNEMEQNIENYMESGFYRG